MSQISTIVKATLFLICRKLILCVLFFLFQVVFVRLRIPSSSIFKSSHKMLRSGKVAELLFRARLETAEVVFSGPKMDSLSVSFVSNVKIHSSQHLCPQYILFFLWQLNQGISQSICFVCCTFDGDVNLLRRRNFEQKTYGRNI